jgi:hypothetical protein
LSHTYSRSSFLPLVYAFFYSFHNYFYDCTHSSREVQLALDIPGLFICDFAHSQSKYQVFWRSQSKVSSNLRVIFGLYLFTISKCLQQITRDTSTFYRLIWLVRHHGICNFFKVCMPSSKTRVSNTRPTGSMWPARCIVRPANISKNWLEYKVWSYLYYFEEFYVNCGQQSIFSMEF